MFQITNFVSIAFVLIWRIYHELYTFFVRIRVH